MKMVSYICTLIALLFPVAALAQEDGLLDHNSYGNWLSDNIFHGDITGSAYLGHNYAYTWINSWNNRYSGDRNPAVNHTSNRYYTHTGKFGGTDSAYGPTSYIVGDLNLAFTQSGTSDNHEFTMEFDPTSAFVGYSLEARKTGIEDGLVVFEYLTSGEDGHARFLYDAPNGEIVGRLEQVRGRWEIVGNDGTTYVQGQFHGSTGQTVAGEVFHNNFEGVWRADNRTDSTNVHTPIAEEGLLWFTNPEAYGPGFGAYNACVHAGGSGCNSLL